MSVIRSHPYRSVSKQVLDWCAWYTRDLDPRVAAERRDEIASDLYEHGSWADESDLRSASVRWAIMMRAFRGVPADLAWRAGQLRERKAADPVGYRMRRSEEWFAGLVFTLAVALLGFGVFVLVRSAVYIAPVIGQMDSWPFTSTRADEGLMVLTAIAGVGIVLLARRARRFTGALLLILPSIGIIYCGVKLLSYISVTMYSVISLVRHLELGVFAASGGCVLVFAAAALLWWPIRAAKTTAAAARQHPAAGRGTGSGAEAGGDA